jgi:hypothetical protein
VSAGRATWATQMIFIKLGHAFAYGREQASAEAV